MTVTERRAVEGAAAGDERYHVAACRADDVGDGSARGLVGDAGADGVAVDAAVLRNQLDHVAAVQLPQAVEHGGPVAPVVQVTGQDHVAALARAAAELVPRDVLGSVG